MDLNLTTGRLRCVRRALIKRGEGRRRRGAGRALGPVEVPRVADVEDVEGDLEVMLLATVVRLRVEQRDHEHAEHLDVVERFLPRRRPVEEPDGAVEELVRSVRVQVSQLLPRELLLPPDIELHDHRLPIDLVLHDDLRARRVRLLRCRPRGAHDAYLDSSGAAATSRTAQRVKRRAMLGLLRGRAHAAPGADRRRNVGQGGRRGTCAVESFSLTAALKIWIKPGKLKNVEGATLGTQFYCSPS